MNILVIGNGFDLAHGLPTSYSDFLLFIEHISIDNVESILHKFKPEHKEYFRKYINNRDNPYLKEIISLCKNNKWIEWFENRKNFINGNWVDFEAEISNVIQQLDNVSQIALNKSQYTSHDLMEYSHMLSMMWEGFPPRNYRGWNWIFNEISITELEKIKDILINDLNRLIRCLELYLIDYVGKIEKGVLSPDITRLHIEKILSFNYTTTYSTLYPNKRYEVDYVHGQAKLESNPPNNIVLGIDEYLPKERKNQDLLFIEFKKYFQRIQKRTGSLYKKWLEKKEPTHVYFFGHSLDVTDKDILRDIILSPLTKITIFYRNEKQYASQIRNLVQVLSQDTLISMVYGTHPQIEFKQQQSMISISTEFLPENAIPQTV